jgi:8-oxo-dGTP diphosphatase
VPLRLGQEVQALPRSPDLSATEPIHVVAGILRDAQDRILITQRTPGRHMAGRWEFPGGKIHPREGSLRALGRELAEEIGVAIRAARPLIEIRHRYPERTVVLHVFAVERYDGVPEGREGQGLQWLPREALAGADLLEADRPILAALALPDRYLITGEPARDPERFLARLEAALDRGVTLVQLRAPALEGALFAELARVAARACHARRARLLVNGDPAVAGGLALACDAAGVHVPARHLAALARWRRPSGLLVGASTHDEAELRAARDAGADFVVLGPVKATPTHPDARLLGWARFAALARGAGLPVYALGGLGTDDLHTAWDSGAQGIAAVRALWDGIAPRT